MKLRNVSSYVRISTEEEKQAGPAVRLVRKISKYAYFLFLLLIVVFVAMYFYGKSRFIEGEGQVHMQNVTLRAPMNLQVKKLFVREGEQLQQDRELMQYEQNLEPDTTRFEVGMPLNVRETMVSTREKIRSAELEGEQLRAQLRDLKGERERLRSLQALDIFFTKEAKALDLRIAEAEKDISVSQNRIAANTRLLREVSGLRRDYQVRVPAKGSIVSPLSGQVGRLYVSENELALRGEPLMSISTPSDVSIKGFFDTRYINYLSVGKRVDIIFPEGTESKGRITSFYISTFPLPGELQKRFEPVHRSIVVDIAPVSPEDYRKWRSFYKLGVTLRFDRW
ncbi:MAG: HlyD family efflux transporter periplasmic adaptor subunit [Nitrospirales bacterium]|nr:HlyD family efflux transporter periplasmic adaptor subunit [Nitrospirales bacterium]